ncbi:MAG: DUF2877 domain-containing protein [Candidatus Hadarchaeales archaeon]
MAREIQAVTISQATMETIKSCSWGEVHSVFEKAFNILMNGRLIGVGRKDVSPGPFNMIVDLPPNKNMRELKIERGIPVAVKNGKVMIGDFITIRISDASIWKPKTKTRAKSVEEIKRNWRVGKETAISAGTMKGFGMLIPLIEKILSNEDVPQLEGAEKAAYKYLTFLVDLVLRRKTTELEEPARGLIGLGAGLTPSGDDVLSGFMAALWWLCSSLGVGVEDVKKINDAITAQARQTTLLSRQILDHASKGEVAERVEKLLEALLAGGAEDVERHVNDVIKIGETSGTDMLLGILLGVKVGLALAEG